MNSIVFNDGRNAFDINERKFYSKAKVKNAILTVAPSLAFLIVVAFAVGIVVFVAIRGIGGMKWSLFSLTYTSENSSIMTSLLNTLFVTVASVAISGLWGVGSAIFLTQYAKSTNPLVWIVQKVTVTLSSIPSIVYGIWGFLTFAVFFHLGYSLLGGILTLSVMMVSLVMKTSEEALKAVDKSTKDASLALGATRFYTLVHITLPLASSAILNGLVVSAGRALGESAALIYTAGTVAKLPKGVFDSGRTLAVHLYSLWCEGRAEDSSYAVALCMLVFCVVFNVAGRLISKRR